MCSLQLPNCRGLEQSEFAGFSSVRMSSVVVIRSSFWGGGLGSCDAEAKARRRRLVARRSARVLAVPCSELKLNLNEYMVTLERPLGICFALSADGKVFVHALQKGGNAEKSGIIMVGDTLREASGPSDEKLIEIKGIGDIESLTKEKSGACSLVFERPSAPFPIHQLFRMDDIDISFNQGRVPISSWNKSIQASNMQDSSESSGNSGFAVFSPKFLNSQGWKYLNDQNKNGLPFSPVVAIFTEEGSENADWGHGSFPLEEYEKALDRSKRELYYHHSLGMRYTKITEQLYVGSCIQTKEDVQKLSAAGVTAVLNFQSVAEAANWGIDSNSINESCQNSNILMINYKTSGKWQYSSLRKWQGASLRKTQSGSLRKTQSGSLRKWQSHSPGKSSTYWPSYSLRDAYSLVMRKKLPFFVGLLQRLLKKNHRVYVTCTSGLDRSPTCVIAYLHWMTDTSLHSAYSFVTGLHPCNPIRPAIAWATWDLIAMAENGNHDGPATHAVTFVWNGHEGEEVYLVGDFTGNWKEPIRVANTGGPRYEFDVRLPQGKYYYKFITNGDWRHSTASPVERDESGNMNNVIVVGDTASLKPTFDLQKKDANIVKVIERPLTENERFMLAKAAQCVAFGVCPIRLAPK